MARADDDTVGQDGSSRDAGTRLDDDVACDDRAVDDRVILDRHIVPNDGVGHASACTDHAVGTHHRLGEE